MKFARYLEDTQIPEWKRAYIDYARLKKCISQIVLAASLESEWPPSSVASISGAVTPEGLSIPYMGAPYSPNGGRIGVTEPPSPDAPPMYGSPRVSQPTFKIQQPPIALYAGARSLHDIPSAPNLEAGTGPGELPKRRYSILRPRPSSFSSAFGTLPPFSMPQISKPAPRSYAGLRDIMISLTPVQRRFFEMLNEELRKVDKFYVERECEALALSSLLKKQLRELQRRLVDDSDPMISHRWLSSFELLNPVKQLSSAALDKLTKSPTETNFRGGYALGSEGEGSNTFHSEVYHQNKKKLKKALLEHYRGMELLNNYRILNLTGFRKALKKFEKVTKIPAQNPYITEKVEACSFASDTVLQQMMKEVEDVYAQVFGGGDRKAARSRLRTIKQPRTHHWKTFRSGSLIGLSLPALAHGIYFSLQPETRAAIPAWSVLLQLYGSLFVLVLFVLLISFNIVVWSRARINYVFIFGLDLRTIIDPREFVEIPSLLFLTLSYAFWLSFSRLGTVPPTTWPLVWLVFTAIFIFAPLRIYIRPSRWWFIRKAGRLLASGTCRVEFTDFWLGDQFCSLSFTMSMLWVAGCAYRNGWQPDTVQKCSLSEQWGLPCALSALPSALRLIQCIKRYKDGGQYMNLINAGKYLSRIMYYVFYFLWRQKGGDLQGYTYAMFWISAIIMSVYLAGWDMVVDWSLLDSHAPHRFLRSNLIYTNYISAYYFIIIFNLAVRFSWVALFPHSSRHFAVRSFVLGVLEVIRRVLWNFLRLENEHIGNIDQYRVTREVPLPYTVRDDDKDDVYSDDNGQIGRRKTFVSFLLL